jgi:hypothetical protein
MPRFDCTILHEDAARCEAMIDVRTTAGGWEGVILMTTPADAIDEPGTYTLRLADGADHTVVIKSVRPGGGRVTFVGSGSAPRAPR